MDSKADAVLKHDANVLHIARAAGARPNLLSDAGQRVWARVSVDIEMAHQEKRERIDAHLDMLTAARLAALGHPSTYEPKSRLLSGFQDEVRSFQAYQRWRGDLETTSALEAYLEYYAHERRSSEERSGQNPPETEHIKAERRAQLDSAQAINHCAKPAYFLARELQRLVAQDLDKTRKTAEWWEIATLILAVEFPDYAEKQLGIEPRLNWGEWELPGDDIFDQRDGMKDYLELDVGCRGDSYTLLVARTAQFLGHDAPHPEQTALLIDTRRGTARLGTEVFPLTSKQVHVLSGVVSGQGGWVPLKTLKTNAQSEERPDRVLHNLPKELLKVIEFRRGEGARITVPASTSS